MQLVSRVSPLSHVLSAAPFLAPRRSGRTREEQSRCTRNVQSLRAREKARLKETRWNNNARMPSTTAHA